MVQWPLYLNYDFVVIKTCLMFVMSQQNHRNYISSEVFFITVGDCTDIGFNSLCFSRKLNINNYLTKAYATVKV